MSKEQTLEESFSQTLARTERLRKAISETRMEVQRAIQEWLLQHPEEEVERLSKELKPEPKTH